MNNMVRLYRNKSFLLLVGLLILVLFAGCSIRRPLPPGRVFDKQEVHALITHLDEQEALVSTFISSGSASITSWASNSDASILTVGTRNPFRIKMEIAHPWGKPILHMTIDEHRIEAFSFQENRLYRGSSTAATLSQFFPEGMSRELLWSVLRGYPSLLDASSAVSRKENYISLLDESGDVMEIIEVTSEGRLPHRVSVPSSYITMVFSDVHEEKGIRYAREVNVAGLQRGVRFVITSREVVFNREIPDAVFELATPPDYDTYDLDLRIPRKDEP